MITPNESMSSCEALASSLVSFSDESHEISTSSFDEAQGIDDCSSTNSENATGPFDALDVADLENDIIIDDCSSMCIITP